MLPKLPNVTLVAVTSVALEATLAALETSMKKVEFGHALLLTDKSPGRSGDKAIEWRKISPIRSRLEYSRFMLHELADHIETSHALCIQWDGFVLRGEAWDPKFADYDYIGAVWPHFSDGKRVGNGGFSLRSRKLLKTCKSLPFDGSEQEDVLIARTFREALERRGVRFAPEQLARKFSFERTLPTGDEFGFHGAFNLVRYLSSRDAMALFSSLERGVLTFREHLELLRWAIRHGRFGLALVIASRLRRRQSIVQ